MIFCKDSDAKLSICSHFGFTIHIVLGGGAGGGAGGAQGGLHGSVGI